MNHADYLESGIIGSGQYVNLLVAFSNIFGIFMILCDPKWVGVCTVTCSVLMHLSERKHGLPGISPFNNLSAEFLWMDRIMAYISTTFALYNMYNKWIMVPRWLIYYGVFGLILMIIAEMMITDQWNLFIVFHTGWHFIAYSYYYLILTL